MKKKRTQQTHKKEEKRSYMLKGRSNWIMVSIILYIAFIPLVSGAINNDIDFDKVHEGYLDTVAGETKNGLYGSTYTSGEFLRFSDGTIVKADKLVINDVLRNGTVVICGTYTKGFSLPLDDFILFGSSELYLNRLICLPKEDLKENHKIRLNTTMLLFAAVFYYYMLGNEKRRKNPPEEADSLFPLFK